MKQLKLKGKHGNGKFALLDDEDYEYINKFSWICSKNKHNFYLARQGNKNDLCAGMYKKTIFMHRVILNQLKGTIVDHIDGNGLNNQKSNLRIVTPSQNMMNRRKNKNTASDYKGVSLNKRKLRGKPYSWMSTISINNKKMTIGRYDSQIEAAKAYDKKAKELFGEFAKLNFPV